MAVPKLHLVDAVPFLAMPELVERLSTTRRARLMYGVMARLPFYRRLIRHLRYEFP